MSRDSILPSPLRPIWRYLSLTLVVLLLAACGTSDETAPATTEPSEQITVATTADSDHEDHGHDDEADHHEDDTDQHDGDLDLPDREEHSEARPRLAIVERGAPNVHFLDLESGDIVGSIELTFDDVVTEGLTTTADSRYLLIGGTAAVDVIDGGAWSVLHGDHFDYYTQPPALVGTVEGPNPTHLISNGAVTAFYFDGSGEAIVVDEAGLARGEIDMVDVIDTGAAHHGFAVPVDGGFIVTWTYGEEVLMPDHLAVLDDTGSVISEHACTQTHGEAHIPDGVAAACEDGILVLTTHGDHWDGRLVGYPEVDDADPYGFGDARAWLIDAVHGVGWGASVMSSNHLLITDFQEETATAHDLGQRIAIRGIGIHAASGTAVALTHDGVVHLIDPVDGRVVAQREVVEPFPPPNPAVSARTLHAAGDHAWVVDPDANLIVELDLANDLAELRRFELDFSPEAVRAHGIR